MLDIKFIREHKEIVKEGALKKKVNIDIDKLIDLDDRRIEKMQIVENIRAELNSAGSELSKLKDLEKENFLTELQNKKQILKEKELELKEITENWQTLMLRVPNIPDISVPLGDSDEDNIEIKSWGEKTVFDFEVKDHIEIMKDLNMVDFERGTKAHGFRGYFLKNDGANLSWAIWNYARDFFGKKGFEHFLAPVVVHNNFFYGTGHLPNDAEDLYQTQDGDNLAGTAEVPMMAYHSDEVLSHQELPKKYLAFTPCYRREAGSHGKDTKGLIRVHEFYKLEQVILCEAKHEESVKWHEWLNRNTEEFIESLGIPYRTVLNCGGDLGLGQVKKYDIELWVPGEKKYREISSASFFHDFQTRRFNIRYKNQENKMNYVHSLNATAIPTPRILVSLIENFQNENGEIIIPEPLVDYMHKERISKNA